LTGRFCPEVGEAFGYFGTLIRLKTAIEVMQWSDSMLKKAGIDPRPITRKLFLPMIGSASLEDDETLQGRWAALLANASDAREWVPILLGFSDVLKQLTKKAALFLDGLYEVVERAIDRDYHNLTPRSRWAAKVDLQDWTSLIRIYADLGLTYNDAQTLTTHGPTRPRTDEGYGVFTVTIDDLVRKNLISRNPRAMVPARPSRFDSILESKDHFAMTAFGYEFVAACRAPA